jgi:hypothetical protein
VSYGVWRRVTLVKTDVSEERIASIFRLEKSASKKKTPLVGTLSIRQLLQDPHRASSQKTIYFKENSVHEYDMNEYTRQTAGSMAKRV